MSRVDDAVRGRKALLLDFDGPVCRVFAGFATTDVVSHLGAYLANHRVDMPAGLECNPLKLLAWVGRTHPSLVHDFDDRLCDLEVQAVKSATPTEYAHETIHAATARGLAVAIVSNNARQAIECYLALHSLAGAVSVVVGREPGNPELLKPHPYAVQRAVDLLGVQPDDCVLIGDSVTDIAAAHSAGVGVIGYAKSPEREPALAAAAPDAMVASMRDMTSPLLAA